MHRICSIKNVLTAVLVMILVITAGGCSRKTEEIQDGIQLEEWLVQIHEQAGLEGDDVLNAAENWGILPPDADIKKAVDRKTAAYVLAHLYSENVSGNADFAESGDCEWTNEIAFMLDMGWMRTDRDGKFHPDDPVTSGEAEELLSAVVWAMNHREFVPRTEVRWKDGSEPADITGVSFDEETLTAAGEKTAGLQEGQLVRIKDQLFRVTGADPEYHTVSLQKTDFLKETDAVDVQGEYDLDWNDAVIETDGEETVNSSAGFGNPKIRPYTRTVDIKGFRVKITASPSGIRAEASRTLMHGSRFTAALMLNGIRCAYAWKSSDTDSSYLRIQCSTIEKAALRNGTAENLYSDFSRMDRKDLFGSLRNMFVSRRDVLEGSLTLCTVTLPLPEAPGVSLKTSVELHMYASGRIELSLSQKHVIGFEVRHGNVRLIRDTEKRADAVIHADTSVTAGIRFALTLFRAELMDAFLEAGAEALLSVTMHRYDENGHVHSEEAAVDPELAEEYSLQDPKWQVCTDMHANWLMNIRLNSSRTAAGKLGLSRSYAVLTAENAPLFPLPKLHMEHFQPVAECTVKDAVVLRTMEPLDDSDTIELASYSVEVNTGGHVKIEVTGLPEEYEIDDLVFRSSAPEIASAAPDGEITGLHTGAGYILVETEDGKYRVFCHVMVTEPAS